MTDYTLPKRRGELPGFGDIYFAEDVRAEYAAGQRDMLERCVALCESRITPGTGSNAILMGAANEIKEMLS